MKPAALALLATLLAGGPASAAHAPSPTGPTQAPTDDEGLPVDAGGGIVHGPHHAFVIEAPTGWVFDNRSGVRDGLHAVAYRAGETYPDSQSLLYARGQDYAPDELPGIDEFVARDVARMREASPRVETFALPSIRMEDGSEARVVGFRGDKWGNVEAVAYIPLPRSIVVLALTARTQARFDADLPAFGDFVRSYRPLDRQ